MIWQDIVIGVGGWLFAVALVPTIYSEKKPPWPTSLLTASILTSYVVAMLTLNLKMGAVSTGVTALCWWTIFYQVTRRKNEKEFSL